MGFDHDIHGLDPLDYQDSWDAKFEAGKISGYSIEKVKALRKELPWRNMWEAKKSEIFEREYDTHWYNGILGFNRSGYQIANANRVAGEQAAVYGSWFPFLARTVATGAATVGNMFLASKLQPAIQKCTTGKKSAPKPSSSEQQEEDSGLFSGMSTSEWV